MAWKRAKCRRSETSIGRIDKIIMADKKSTRQAYGEYLVKLGEKNPQSGGSGCGSLRSNQTNIFKNACPERHFNVGIAEVNLMGMAAGLATAGKAVPFASTFAIFGAGRAYEIIRNSICYPKLNVKIALTHSGISLAKVMAVRTSPSKILR